MEAENETQIEPKIFTRLIWITVYFRVELL